MMFWKILFASGVFAMFFSLAMVTVNYDSSESSPDSESSQTQSNQAPESNKKFNF